MIHSWRIARKTRCRNGLRSRGSQIDNVYEPLLAQSNALGVGDTGSDGRPRPQPSKVTFFRCGPRSRRRQQSRVNLARSVDLGRREPRTFVRLTGARHRNRTFAEWQAVWRPSPCRSGGPSALEICGHRGRMVDHRNLLQPQRGCCTVDVDLPTFGHFVADHTSRRIALGNVNSSWRSFENAAAWGAIMIDLFATAKGLAAWFVPLAVVAYIALYFGMAIIAVIVWKNGRDPRIRQVWSRFARLNLPRR